MQRTNFGKKEKGNSRFVIVAPHAAGDDLRTAELAEEIGRLINGSVIINEIYVQRTSARSYQNPYVEDFNFLPWSDERQAYQWDKRHPDMKEFYENIKEYAEAARQYGNGRAVIVYIHGMDDDGKNLGIDIGFGAKYYHSKLKGTIGEDRHPDVQDNVGEMRARPEDMEKLKAILSEKLNRDYSINVGIGERYAAWSRNNGVQFHLGSTDYSFQLEISQFLRNPKRIKYTAQIIADALKEVFI
jgi:hypothetical protein